MNLSGGSTKIPHNLGNLMVMPHNIKLTDLKLFFLHFLSSRKTIAFPRVKLQLSLNLKYT